MKRATLPQAIGIMKNGNHCLWVGAGVTMQLVGPANALSWSALVDKLELEAGLTPPSGNPELPERLERCKARLGESKFRQVVRAELHDRIYQRIIQMALDADKSGSIDVPKELKALAYLGAIGNPIVSFNIELATAIALSASNGPALIKSYSKSIAHHLAYNIGFRPVRLARKVFLPHGCLELADCVLTTDEYKTHEASMSFQLATHQSYASGLFIVGMSLGDAYLLEQIRTFRRWMGEIYWVQPNADDNSKKLATQYDLTLIEEGSWQDFWSFFTSPLHADLCPAPADLYQVWIKLIEDARLYLGTPKLIESNAMDPDISPDEKQQLLAESDSAGEGRPLPALPANIRNLDEYRNKLRAEQKRITGAPSLGATRAP